MQANWGHIWKHIVETIQTGAINITLNVLRKEPWGNTWKLTVEKNQTNVINVIRHLLRQAIRGRIWKYTVEKSQQNATSVIIHLLMLEPWGDIWKPTVEKNQTNETSTTLHPPRESAFKILLRKRINKTTWKRNLFPLTFQLTQKYFQQITRNKLFTCMYFFGAAD